MTNLFTVPNGSKFSADDLRTFATDTRGATEDDNMLVQATAAAFVALEALAKTKDELLGTGELLNNVAGELLQLRKEFEALKSQIVRERR